MTDDICRKCDGTGWQPNPVRGGYTWCDCERGVRFRDARRAKRSGDGTWTRVGQRRAAASSAASGPRMRIVRGAKVSSASTAERPDAWNLGDSGDE